MLSNFVVKKILHVLEDDANSVQVDSSKRIIV